MTKFKNFKSYLLLTATLLIGFAATAQVKVGINPTTIDTNAILEMESTNKGMLLPRLALTSTSAPAPLGAHVAGMTVYNTAAPTGGNVTPGFYYNSGSAWVRVGNATAPSNTTSGQLINVSNGNGATFTAMTVAVDTGALKLFVTNAVVSGGVTGKNTTEGSLISITNGTGASFTAMVVAVDTAALRTFISTTATAGALSGQNLSAGTLLQTTGTPTGASLKATGYQVDTTALKTFMNGKVQNAVSPPLTGNGTTSSPLAIGQNGATTGQIMTWGGTGWVPQDAPSGADNWGTQTAVVSAPLTGGGTAGSPLSVTRATATDGLLTKVTNGANAVFTPIQYNVDTAALKTFLNNAGYDNTADRFVENAGNTVVSTGSVGIGNTAPTHNLHVTGNTRVTTKPMAAKTDSVVMRFTDGELRQMSIARLLGQLDTDGDGVVDAEDPDIDGDNIANATDSCKMQYGCTPSGCPRSCGVAIPAWNAATAAAITSTGTCALISTTSIRCVFSYTGSDQTLTTPAGASVVTVKLWGAGGGGGGNESEGAGGGYITGSILNPASNYTVIVGQGGVNGGTSSTYGGGGAGGGSSSGGSGLAGSGGGRSALRLSSTEIMTAGAGGGGSGWEWGWSGLNFIYGSGGPGGGTVGLATASQPCSGSFGNGLGGTQTAGGAAGIGSCGNTTAGSQFTGGNGGNCDHRGGGGGAGYYGGGGGNVCSVTEDGGGGGGSSFALPIVNGVTNTAGNQRNPANSSDSDYTSGIGVGGLVNTNGGNGRVVVYFTR